MRFWCELRTSGRSGSKPLKWKQRSGTPATAVAARPAAQRPVRHVPEAGVDARIAQHGRAGRELEPALVEEQPAGRVDRALLHQPLRPPGEEAAAVAARADDAPVEGTGHQDVLLRRVATVTRERAEQVAGERQVVARDGTVERAVDADVGVEVEHGRALLEQMQQQPRLERAHQRERLVGRDHVLQRWAVEGVKAEHLERLGPGRRIAHDERGHAGAGVVLAHRPRQHPRSRDVVRGDDRCRRAGSCAVAGQRLARRPVP